MRESKRISLKVPAGKNVIIHCDDLSPLELPTILIQVLTVEAGFVSGVREMLAAGEARAVTCMCTSASKIIRSCDVRGQRFTRMLKSRSLTPSWAHRWACHDA